MDKSTTTTYGDWLTVTEVELGHESMLWLVVMGLAALVLAGYLVVADKRKKKTKGQ